MSNLGFQTVYRTLGTLPGMTCERSFFPDPALRGLLRKYNRRLFSYETKRPLAEFDVVAFSVTYEMDYLYVLEVLEFAGIPLARRDRGEGDPILVAGGAAITANPETLEPVLDIIFLGEAEVGGESLFQSLQSARREALSSEALLGMPQVHLPGRGQPAPQVYPALPDLVRHHAASCVLTPDTVFSDTALLEVTRGCPRRCSFCIAKDLYGSTRHISLETAVGYARTMRSHTDRIGLLGAGISDYDGLDELVAAVSQEGFEVTVSSLRFDKLTPSLLENLSLGRQRTLTLAPESFSRQQQRFLKKGFALRKIREGLDQALSVGFQKIKYYLMYGVPNEGEDSFAPLLEHVEEILPVLEKTGVTLELSFSILEPKPRTELARTPLASRDQVRRTERFLARNIPRSPAVRRSFPSFKMTYTSDLLSRGDAMVGQRLLDFYETRRPGQRFTVPYRDYLAEMDRLLGAH